MPAALLAANVTPERFGAGLAAGALHCASHDCNITVNDESVASRHCLAQACLSARARLSSWRARLGRITMPALPLVRDTPLAATAAPFQTTNHSPRISSQRQPSQVCCSDLTRGCVGVFPDADVTCFGAYLTVPDDPQFRVSAKGGRADGASHDWYHGCVHECGVFGLGGVGPAWYRLPAGHGLQSADPGYAHCGTGTPGWLSGWLAGADQDSDNGWRQPGTNGPDDAGQPGSGYSTPAIAGALPPPVGQPPATGTVCFNNGPHGGSHTAVHAVSCGAFALWELPPIPRGYNNGYCLAD
jgi:hypothetical protein